MKDRGIIKWLPFDSCFSGQHALHEVNSNKERIHVPVLSEDQIISLETKIFDAYHLNEDITIKYFYNGKILTTKGQIKAIDALNQNILLNNKWLYFKQIISIE